MIQETVDGLRNGNLVPVILGNNMKFVAPNEIPENAKQFSLVQYALQIGQECSNGQTVRKIALAFNCIQTDELY